MGRLLRHNHDGDPVAASYDGIGLRRTCHLQRGTKTLSWDVYDPRPEDKALVVDTGKRELSIVVGSSGQCRDVNKIEYGQVRFAEPLGDRR
ncbi:MAG: hypothetical protein WBV37_17570 [Nocardioidaceae bacterium]